MNTKNTTKEQSNAPACTDSAEAWERLVARVVDPFDLGVVGQRCAVDRWRKFVANERDGEPRGKVVHEFASEDVLAAAEDDPEQVIARAALSGSLRKDDRVNAFLADLVKFIDENGERGRDLVSRVCENENAARRVEADVDMPRPLRALAGLATQFRRGSNKLPDEGSPLEFTAALTHFEVNQS